MTTIQLRRDTAENWSSVNPILSQGEAGYDITNKVLKIGDGTTPWNNLPQYGGSGGGGDYNDLTNKPQINSVELDGDVSLSTLGLYSISEVDDKLINKQNIFTPESPLTIEEITVSPHNNMTYTNGSGSVLTAPFNIYKYKTNPFPNTNAVPSNAGDTTTSYRVQCAKVDAFGDGGSSSVYSSVTSGSDYAFVTYPFTVSGVETLFPINYQLGYFDNSGNFNFVTTSTLASATGGAVSHRIISPLSEYGIVPSSSYTNGICISVAVTHSTFTHNIYYSITVEGNNVTTKWYDVNIDGGTISVTQKGTYTLNNATIASLMGKVKAGLYFPDVGDVSGDGSIATINPILNAQHEPIFNGANSEPTVYSSLLLNLSATSGNALEVKSDGLYVGSYTLPTANSTTLGGVKIGDGVAVTDDGTISVASVNGFKFWSGTQTAYDELTTKDENTLYIITGE